MRAWIASEEVIAVVEALGADQGDFGLDADASWHLHLHLLDADRVFAAAARPAGRCHLLVLLLLHPRVARVETPFHVNIVAPRRFELFESRETLPVRLVVGFPLTVEAVAVSAAAAADVTATSASTIVAAPDHPRLGPLPGSGEIFLGSEGFGGFGCQTPEGGAFVRAPEDSLHQRAETRETGADHADGRFYCGPNGRCGVVPWERKEKKFLGKSSASD